ncbi:MAG: thioredoxin family protein [Sphingomonadales bacterium]|nr:thioredoxin family protein [Sphingomonadales bacterium]
MIRRAVLAGMLVALLPFTPARAGPVRFPQDDAADFTLETAVADAHETHRYAVIVFGADWCHDSRFLADVLTSEEFTREFGERFAVTFIDVGRPQVAGQGRNLSVVASLGVNNLRSTPALLVVAGDGRRLNSKRDAVSWRNAESRGKDAILGWFRDFLKRSA